MPVGHSYWGVFAGIAQLPNVLGAPIQSAKVQVGDTAYDSVTGKLQMCLTATIGAATWSDVQGIPDELKLWEPVNTASFSLFAQDATGTMGMSYGTNPVTPFEPALLLSTPAGGISTPTTIFQPVGFSWPSTNRIRMICRLGPRATSPPGISPTVYFGCQAASRSFGIARYALATGEWTALIRNNTPTSSAFNSGQGIGAGQLVIDVAVRHPSPGIDPAFEVCVASGSGYRLRINSLSTSFTGASPPHSAGWNAAWQAGGNLVVGWGGFEYTGIGSAFISSIGILKHPLDW